MKQTRKIVKALGRQEMAEALDVSLKAISKQVVRGQFPPSWYLVMQNLCAEKGIDCPVDLFGMKPTNGRHSNVSPGANQAQPGDAA